MTTKVAIKARAKINLTLDVIGKRPDGYHDVEMIMQQINLFDLVTISKREGDADIVITSSDLFLPKNEGNLAYLAAKQMMTQFNLPTGFDIHIEKNIPVSAGLAGGSTDAAAVIVGISMLMDENVPLEMLETIGLRIGADVPFCIRGNCCIARGLGEKLEPIQGLSQMWIVLVKPNFGVSTKEVYTHLNLEEVKEKPDTQAMVQALLTQDKNKIVNNLCNVLETVTLKRYPEVEHLKSQLVSFGADGVLMSGSGPTVFGLFKNLNRAKLAHKNIKRFFNQSYIVTAYNGEI